MNNILPVDVVEPVRKLRHPKLGETYVPMARRFLDNFPLDSHVNADDFDDWAFNQRLLDNPGTKDKGSAAWAKHVQQRNILRKKLNLGGASHAMALENKFQLDVVKQGEVYLTAKLTDQVTNRAAALPKALGSFVQTKTDMLNHMIESVDPANLSLDLSREMNSIRKSLIHFQKRFALEQSLLEENFIDLQAEFEKQTQLRLPSTSDSLFDDDHDDAADENMNVN